MKPSIKSLFFFLLALILPLSFPLFARESARDAQKLSLLKQATGTSTSGASAGSFQARVDADFQRSSSAASAYVENQEAAERVEAQAEAEQAAKIILESPPSPSRVDASQLTYQKQAEKTAQEAEAERQKKQIVAETVPQEEKGPAKVSKLPPSLANNPFYFGGAAAPGRSFEDDKPIIASRLIQKGYSPSETQRIVMEASSPEEVILALMQDEGYSYGDALDLVKTS